MGTLCIIDKVPRQFSAEAVVILKDLASMLEDELDALKMATLDELTGISNRRGFLQLAEHCLNFCLRQAMPASLVYIDWMALSRSMTLMGTRWATKPWSLFLTRCNPRSGKQTCLRASVATSLSYY